MLEHSKHSNESADLSSYMKSHRIVNKIQTKPRSSHRTLHKLSKILRYFWLTREINMEKNLLFRCFRRFVELLNGCELHGHTEKNGKRRNKSVRLNNGEKQVSTRKNRIVAAFTNFNLHYINKPKYKVHILLEKDNEGNRKISKTNINRKKHGEPHN